MALAPRSSNIVIISSLPRRRLSCLLALTRAPRWSREMTRMVDANCWLLTCNYFVSINLERSRRAHTAHVNLVHV
jgi:hypothetical protein